jgi:drug/metabolite transporter (DMT)-like permease
MAPENRAAPRWAVALALGIVYLVWGSTYAAIRVALDGFPPFLLGGTRFLAAGALLLLIALAARRPLPSRRQAKQAAAVGLVLLVVGNGGVVWAEQYVASGLAAVVIATVPLWMVGLDAAHPRGERLTAGVVLSMLLGLAGVGMLMTGGIALGRGTRFWIGVGCLVAASAAWALGSIYARHAEKPVSFATYTAVEMIAAGAALMLLASLRGEWSLVDPGRLVGPPLWANLYLVVFGSLVAFSAYVWLLRAAPPALVGTYAYVNPAVALLLGVFFLGESFDGWTLAGSLVILASVVLTQVARLRGAGRIPSPAPECGGMNGAETAEAARTAGRRGAKEGVAA